MASWVFCLADSSYYRLPFFGPDDLFFSPDIQCEDKNTFRIPSSVFHISDFINSRGELKDSKPDFVFIKTDATRRNLIRGLIRLGCPSFVSIADTHHLYRPLETMLQYISDEDFTFISAENDRHHLKWYKRAGFSNLCWVPNVALYPEVIPPPAKTLIHKIAFVGSLGKFHPFRAMVIEVLKLRYGDKLAYGAAKQAEASRIYNSSLISLNISLNSDLNWRFFEVIAAGGFLLTDRLPKQSGIEILFTEGIHYEAFGSEEELIQKVDFYLANPSKAAQIARQGHLRYIANLKASRLRSEVIKLSFGINPSPFSYYPNSELASNDHGLATLRAYQTFQELHRLNSKVIVVYQKSLLAESLIEDLKDFPRICAIELTSRNISSILNEVSSYNFSRKAFGVMAIESYDELPLYADLFLECSAIVVVNGCYDREIISINDEVIYRYDSKTDCYIKS